VIYDSNQISIEDDTNIAFTESVTARYESYGWHTQTVDWKKTGNYVEDVEELYNAIEKAKAETDKPSLITLRTIIGWPSPKKQNSGKIHGSALGAEELAGLKTVLGFDPEKTFEVDPTVLEHTRDASRFNRERAAWEASFDAWASENADKKALLERIVSGETPAELEAALPVFEGGSSISTRVASGKVINAIAKVMPELWGGSADLADSNMTTIEGGKSFVPTEWSTHEWSADPYGRVMHFGIREHAMGSILNGIVLHGNTRAFGGTFLIFSDYMRPAVRLAALMGIPSIFVWTHDSIALGEDGPTHQPIEQLATLRAIPNLDMVRPADGNETAYAWKTVLERRQGPAGLALSRQNLPVYTRGAADETGVVYAGAENTSKGAYTLLEAANGKPEVILIATGSEVEIAIKARLELEAAGVATRVVSAPCLEWFDEQPAAYREQVLPSSVKAKVSVEAGLNLGWSKYVGPFGKSVSIEHFGASASPAILYREFGMTAEAVVAAARESIAAL
jgi:transketolase